MRLYGVADAAALIRREIRPVRMSSAFCGGQKRSLRPPRVVLLKGDDVVKVGRGEQRQPVNRFSGLAGDPVREPPDPAAMADIVEAVLASFPAMTASNLGCQCSRDAVAKINCRSSARRGR